MFQKMADIHEIALLLCLSFIPTPFSQPQPLFQPMLLLSAK